MRINWKPTWLLYQEWSAVCTAQRFISNAGEEIFKLRSPAWSRWQAGDQGSIISPAVCEYLFRSSSQVTPVCKSSSRWTLGKFTRYDQYVQCLQRDSQRACIDRPQYLPKVLDATEKRCYIIGTIYVDMALKPNILHDLSAEVGILEKKDSLEHRTLTSNCIEFNSCSSVTEKIQGFRRQGRYWGWIRTHTISGGRCFSRILGYRSVHTIGRSLAHIYWVNRCRHSGWVIGQRNLSRPIRSARSVPPRYCSTAKHSKKQWVRCPLRINYQN